MCEFNQMFLRVFSYLNKKLFIFKALKCYILNPVIVLNDYSGHVKASSPSHQSLKGWHLKSVVETLGLSFHGINHKWASCKCSFGLFSAICWMIRHYRLCSHEWEDGCLPMIFVCVCVGMLAAVYLINTGADFCSIWLTPSLSCINTFRRSRTLQQKY